MMRACLAPNAVATTTPTERLLWVVEGVRFHATLETGSAHTRTGAERCHKSGPGAAKQSLSMVLLACNEWTAGTTTQVPAECGALDDSLASVCKDARSAACAGAAASGNLCTCVIHADGCFSNGDY